MTNLKDLTKGKGVIGASVNKKEKGFVSYMSGINPATEKPRTLNADIEVLKGEEYFLIYEKKGKETEKKVL